MINDLKKKIKKFKNASLVLTKPYTFFEGINISKKFKNFFCKMINFLQKYTWIISKYCSKCVSYNFKVQKNVIPMLFKNYLNTNTLVQTFTIFLLSFLTTLSI